MLMLLLLPMAFPLPPGTLAGEIIGGQEARPHSRPYMALMNIQTGGGGFRCGGFLIREDVVVTAAHCNCNLGNISVLLGAHNVAINECGRQEIRVRRRIPHPGYNDEKVDNDIMLLQLKDKAELSKHVNIIHLPPAYQRVPPMTVCSVAGWGRTRPKSQLSDTLQEVDLVVMPDAACPYHQYNPSTMLCAGDPKSHNSSFRGDSGGPLVCEGTAVGIVSFGTKNGKPPGVFTRLSTFVPWIHETMNKLQP